MTDNMLPDDAVHLKGHTCVIRKITVLPGGERIAVASDDKTVRVFSLSSAQCLRTLQGHQDGIYGVEAIDADTIVSVSDDETVRVWRASVSDGNLLRTKRLNESLRSCALLGDQRLVVGGRRGGLHLLEWTGSQLLNLHSVSNAHSKSIGRIAVHDGRFATASDDCTAKIWETATLKCVHALTGHASFVRCVAMNDEFVVTGSGDAAIRVYDAQSYRFLRDIDAHDALIWEVQFVDNGNAVLSVASDQTIAVHALRSGECRWRMHFGIYIYALAVLPDGRVAAGGHEPFDVHVFSTPRYDSSPQDAKSNQLAIAFARALFDPNVVDESFLLQHVRAENVLTVSDLMAGHNLILLAIRLGTITRDNIRSFGGSSRYLKDNLYLPATKLPTDNASFVHYILYHAESVQIIPDTHDLKMAQEIRADVTALSKDVIYAIGTIARHVEFVEERLAAVTDDTAFLEQSVDDLRAAARKIDHPSRTWEEAVQGLSQDLNQLQESVNAQHRPAIYASMARCVLSAGLMAASVSGSEAYFTNNAFLEFTVSDLLLNDLKVGRDLLATLFQVDLSNARTAQKAFSSETLDADTDVRDAVQSAIQRSSFESLEALQALLRDHVADTDYLDRQTSLLDIGSSEWLSDAKRRAEPSVDSASSLNVRAKKYFQYLAHTTDSDSLTFGKAKFALSHLLKECEGLAEVPANKLDKMLYDHSGEENEEVSEDLFVHVFREIREEQEKTSRSRQLISESMERFRKKADDDNCMSLRLAARVLCNLFKEMKRRGLFGDGSELTTDEAAEMLGGADGGGDEVVDEAVFMDVVSALLE